MKMEILQQLTPSCRGEIKLSPLERGQILAHKRGSKHNFLPIRGILGWMYVTKCWVPTYNGALPALLAGFHLHTDYVRLCVMDFKVASGK